MNVLNLVCDLDESSCILVALLEVLRYSGAVHMKYEDYFIDNLGEDPSFSNAHEVRDSFGVIVIFDRYGDLSIK
jgi:hypothetical protein